MRRPALPAVLTTVGIALTVAAVAAALTAEPVPSGAGSAALRGAAATGGRAGDSSPTGVIAALQDRLRRLPRDADAWARLGAAYVQQARITADPAWYPKAEGALRRSLELAPDGNARAAAGLGALANARHDFAGALVWARRAEAVPGHDADAYGVLDDALTQLGRDAEAQAATQKMLDVAPGVPSFARAAYHLELRGDRDGARAALEQALAEARTPPDVAFCRYHLGELALTGGDAEGALAHFAAGLSADAADAPLLAGRARAAAALGRTADALRDWAAVTARSPRPEYLQEYGELLESLGRKDEAAAQYEVFRQQLRLLAAHGANDDLAAAVFEADHGSPAAAVTAARAEWGRRRHVAVADALGWALHRAGKDAEALPLAEQALRGGYRSPALPYHRGAILAALGRPAPARADLTAALELGLGPGQAAAARALLASLP